jgi:hypothetical protein
MNRNTRRKRRRKKWSRVHAKRIAWQAAQAAAILLNESSPLEFYIDHNAGDDANDGRSASSPLRTRAEFSRRANNQNTTNTIHIHILR